MQITSSSINTRFDKPEKTARNTLKLYLQSLLRCEAEIKKTNMLIAYFSTTTTGKRSKNPILN